MVYYKLLKPAMEIRFVSQELFYFSKLYLSHYSETRYGVDCEQCLSSPSSLVLEKGCLTLRGRLHDKFQPRLRCQLGFLNKSS